MSLHHQNASALRQFEQSPHRQRVINEPEHFVESKIFGVYFPWDSFFDGAHDYWAGYVAYDPSKRYTTKIITEVNTSGSRVTTYTMDPDSAATDTSVVADPGFTTSANGSEVSHTVDADSVHIEYLYGTYDEDYSGLVDFETQAAKALVKLDAIIETKLMHTKFTVATKLEDDSDFVTGIILPSQASSHGLTVDAVSHAAYIYPRILGSSGIIYPWDGTYEIALLDGGIPTTPDTEWAYNKYFMNGWPSDAGFEDGTYPWPTGSDSADYANYLAGGKAMCAKTHHVLPDGLGCAYSDTRKEMLFNSMDTASTMYVTDSSCSGLSLGPGVYSFGPEGYYKNRSPILTYSWVGGFGGVGSFACASSSVAWTPPACCP